MPCPLPVDTEEWRSKSATTKTGTATLDKRALRTSLGKRAVADDEVHNAKIVFRMGTDQRDDVRHGPQNNKQCMTCALFSKTAEKVTKDISAADSSATMTKSKTIKIGRLSIKVDDDIHFTPLE